MHALQSAFYETYGAQAYQEATTPSKEEEPNRESRTIHNEKITKRISKLLTVVYHPGGDQCCESPAVQFDTR